MNKFYFHKSSFSQPFFAVVAFSPNILFKFEEDQKTLLLATRFHILQIIFFRRSLLRTDELSTFPLQIIIPMPGFFRCQYWDFFLWGYVSFQFINKLLTMSPICLFFKLVYKRKIRVPRYFTFLFSLAFPINGKQLGLIH